MRAAPGLAFGSSNADRIAGHRDETNQTVEQKNELGQYWRKACLGRPLSSSAHLAKYRSLPVGFAEKAETLRAKWYPLI